MVLGLRSKKQKLLLIFTSLVFLISIMLCSGCAVIPGRRRPRRQTVVIANAKPGVNIVYVEKAPPKLKQEKKPPRPNKSAVWIPGHWKWSGGKYMWVSGRWDLKPKGKSWTPGRWEKRSRGWVWVAGSWR